MVLWVTSVVWPYLKLVLNLAVFVLSLRWACLSKALSWIEAAGKWNHVRPTPQHAAAEQLYVQMDVIVCYLMMLSIRLKIDQHTIHTGTEACAEALRGLEFWAANSTASNSSLIIDSGLLPDSCPEEWMSSLQGLEDKLAELLHLPIQIEVNGRSGLYLYCTAVCLSMCTGHAATLLIWVRSHPDAAFWRRTVIKTAIQDMPHTEQRSRLATRVAGWKMWLVSVLLVCNTAMFIASVTIDFFYVSYKLPIIQVGNDHWSVTSGISKVLSMGRDDASDRAGTVFLGLMLW